MNCVNVRKLLVVGVFKKYDKVVVVVFFVGGNNWVYSNVWLIFDLWVFGFKDGLNIKVIILNVGV